MKISLKCDAYVDQNRYIENDPVGYKCFNDAEYEHDIGFLLCEKCSIMFKEQPRRIILYPPYGKEYQKIIINDYLKDYK